MDKVKRWETIRRTRTSLPPLLDGSGQEAGELWIRRDNAGYHVHAQRMDSVESRHLSQ